LRTQPHSSQQKFTKLYELKPTVIPVGFVLLQDTREQRPLFTRIPKGLTIQSTTLHNGDYSIHGLDHLFAIERKFAGDLYPYCSTEREKTKEKMRRFKSMIDAGGWVGLCIEGKESNIYQYQTFTKVNPEVVRGSIISFAIRYHVQVYFAGNRDNAARYILDHAVRFWNVIHEIT
jgi:ERCC4-type nuclease